MKRTIENLLHRRKKNKSKPINFDEAKAILKKAHEIGVDSVDINIKFSEGKSKEKGTVIYAISFLDTLFTPEEFLVKGKLVSKVEFEGNYTVYSGSSRNEKHYLDLRISFWRPVNNYEDEIYRKGTFSFKTP